MLLWHGFINPIIFYLYHNSSNFCLSQWGYAQYPEGYCVGFVVCSIIFYQNFHQGFGFPLVVSAEVELSGLLPNSGGKVFAPFI